jgi:hypothetical protein
MPNNKSVPASAVVIPADVKKWVLRVFIAITIIACIAIIASLVRSGNHGQNKKDKPRDTPLASQPVSEWAKLTIPVGGKSRIISVPPGMHAVVTGTRATLHTVYTDGHESEIAIESAGSNPDGPIAGIYVTNEAKTPNIVYYAFAP